MRQAVQGAAIHLTLHLPTLPAKSDLTLLAPPSEPPEQLNNFPCFETRYLIIAFLSISSTAMPTWFLKIQYRLQQVGH